MANETYNKLIKIDVNSQSLNELSKTIGEIDQEILNIQQNELKVNQSLEEQEAALKKIAELDKARTKIVTEQSKLAEKSQTQTEKTTKNLENQQKKAEQLFKTTEGIGGAFQVAAGASLLFGDQTSEALSQAQAKVVAIIGITDGLKKTAEGVSNGYKLISENIKKSEIAAKLFGTTTKAAVASTGIGLLIVGLVLMVEYFDEISAAASEFSKAIGFDEVVAGFESVGGAMGVVKITISAIAQAIKAVGLTLFDTGKALVKFFTGDIKGALDSFQNRFADGIKAVQKTITKTQEEESQRRLIKSKENAIKQSEQEIAILKAKGKNVLAQEDKLIKERIALEDLRLVGVKKGSKEEIKINEDKNKLLVDLEANRLAQSEKIFNDRLKQIDRNSNKEILAINEKVKKEKLTELQGQELLLMQQQKALALQIELRRKHKEDVSALLVQQQSLEKSLEENRKDQQEEAFTKRTEALELQYAQELNLLQEARLKGTITDEQYHQKITEMEIKALEDQIALQKEGSKEQLALKKELNDKKIEADQKFDDKEKKRIEDLTNYLNAQTLAGYKNDISNTNLTFKQRTKAAEDYHAEATRQNEAAQQAAAATYGKDSAEYKKLIDEKVKIDEEYNKVSAQLAKEQIAKTAQQAQSILNVISSASSILDELSQRQIDDSQKRIDALSEQNNSLQERINETIQLAKDSTDKINELESELSNSRGERTEQLKQQLEEERSSRQRLAVDEKKLAEQKIANERKVQAEKDKIEKLDKQMKKRQQVLSIAEAVISTAVAVTNALAVKPYPLGVALSISAGVLGAAQVGLIASQKFADGGILEGPDHSHGGIKGTGRFSNIEVEGGEFIVNKRATALYRPLLESINSGKGDASNSFADGGSLPNFEAIDQVTSTTNDLLNENLNRPMFVSVQEINSVSDRVKVIENESSF